MDVPFRLDGDAVNQIQKLAEHRREGAIITLMTGAPMYRREDAEAQNPLEFHLKGVAAEFAVAEWLSTNGVLFAPNFMSVEADLAGAPDLEIAVPRVRCDVKATWNRYPVSQRRSLERKDVVIFCYVQEAVVFQDLVRVIQAYDVRITGWTQAPPIGRLAPDGGWFEVPGNLIHPPDELLAGLTQPGWNPGEQVR